MIKTTVCTALFVLVASLLSAYAMDPAACRESCRDEFSSCKAALLYNCDSSYKECLGGCAAEAPPAEEQKGVEGGRKDEQVPVHQQEPHQEQVPTQDEEQVPVTGQPPN
jgi:hypothetical protein